MPQPQVQLQQQQNMAQSRILFQQVMVDNEPTQQQVLQRAQQLQIDDLSLARQSLTKQLQPFWRPYMNRYGDIYYINLKQRKAYIQHPIDMETKILYAKRHKTPVPKYRAFELQDVSGSVNLIEEQIRKWKKAELFRSTQSIPTQLNIVYQQSEESNTQRQQSQQQSEKSSQSSSQSDQEYIQNLQKSQQENTRSRKSTPRQEKQSFNRGYKKFPSSGNNEHQNQFSQNQEQIQLTPQYERLLIQYEEQLKKEHQKELQFYRQLKHDNYLKKEDLVRQAQKANLEKYKFNVLAEFETQLEEKNQHNFEKETHKMVMDYRQKLQHFQRVLEKQRIVLQKLQESSQTKHEFIQSLQEKMQRKVNQGKYLMQEEVTKQIYQTHFLSEIAETNAKQKESFNNDSHKIIESKLNELIRQKGIKTKKGENLQAYSLTSFYEGIVKRQFEKIDKLLIENQVGRQMRKRTKSIFSKKQPELKESQSHIIFAESQRSIKAKARNKQNNMNIENIVLQQKKQSTIEQIESDILKSAQNNKKFYERRSKIFGTFSSQKSKIIDQSSKKLNQASVISQSFQQNNPINSDYNKTAIPTRADRKSMYLRMMKRIL